MTKPNNKLHLLVIAPLFAALMLMGCSGRSEPKYRHTYSDLINRMIDPTRIADLDSPSSQIMTSYDRSGGNDDFRNPLRRGPDGWDVLADLKGPGYISRFWMTGPPDGTWRVRFYFDGARGPQLEISLDELCGGKEPFLEPIAANEPWCWFSFVPMPYKKRVVVMAQDGNHLPGGPPKLYYQINYNSLNKGHTVDSFSLPLSEADSKLLAETRKKWSATSLRRDATGIRTTTGTHTVPQGGKTTLCDLRGPAMIRDLRITPGDGRENPMDEAPSSLRDLILRIFWNGSTAPSVEVPFGDFFGTPWQPIRYESTYFGLSNNTFYCRFPMPFKESARIELENQTSVALPVTISCDSVPIAQWTNQWGYFHAAWRRTTPDHRGQPHGILATPGTGRYVGCILNTLSYDRSWWLLEGDEYMRIDGESYPSWHGTGLEDYFNAGWYYGNVLVRAFHGIPFKAPFRTIQYRIHQTDPVSFRSDIAVEIERGPDNASRGLMESTAFYYLQKPQASASSLGGSAFRRVPQDPMAPQTVMTEINNLERLNDHRGASLHVAEFLRTYPRHPYAPVLRARLLTYRMKEDGFEATKSALTELARIETNQSARTQLEALLWFHENPSHSLLGVYCSTPSGPAEISLNGQVVARVHDPIRMRLQKMKITPGRHVLAIRTQWNPYPDWVQVCLRTHQGDIITGPDWRTAINPSGDWSKTDFDDSDWSPVGRHGVKGPPEVPHVWCVPNIFPDMQSKPFGLRSMLKWPDRRGYVVYRKTFEIPHPK